MKCLNHWPIVRNRRRPKDQQNTIVYITFSRVDRLGFQQFVGFSPRYGQDSAAGKESTTRRRRVHDFTSLAYGRCLRAGGWGGFTISKTIVALARPCDFPIYHLNGLKTRARECRRWFFFIVISPSGRKSRRSAVVNRVVVGGVRII